MTSLLEHRYFGETTRETGAQERRPIGATQDRSTGRNWFTIQDLLPDEVIYSGSKCGQDFLRPKFSNELKLAGNELDRPLQIPRFVLALYGSSIWN